MLPRLGLWCLRHRHVVLRLWAVVLVAGIFCGGPLLTRMRAVEWPVAASQSVAAARTIADAQPYGSVVEAIVDGPPSTSTLDTARRTLAAIPGVVLVRVPAATSVDGRAVQLVVGLARGAPPSTQDKVVAALHRLPGPVLVGGPDLAASAETGQTVSDTRHGELVALALTLALMAFIFRGFAAALVPVACAAVTVSGAVLILFGLSFVRDLDASVLSVATVLGLGLAIDYGLLQIDRFREERAAGLDVPDAVSAVMARSGRTVLFSGIAVSTALSGLVVFPSPLYTTIALAVASVVLLGVAAALTLTPVLLATFAERIGAAPVPPDEGLFSRLARRVGRHRLLVAVGVAAVLTCAGAPVLSVHLVNDDNALQLPASAPVHRYDTALHTRFAGVGDGDLTVLTSGAEVPALSTVDGVDSVGTPSTLDAQDVVVAVHTAATDPTTVVHRLRELPGVRVTGPAATRLDLVTEVTDYAPAALGVLALATFLVLFVMTGSLLVPLKALVMNTLSLGAALGTMVVVFQEGHLGRLIGLDGPVGGIQLWLPIVVFTFAFGMSMDYEVFLIARIKELHDQGVPNDRAVATGLQRSGRIITNAAALMVVVYAGFITGQTLAVKELGLTLAVAVVVDVTLVRCLLVPATMLLLGRWNWFPRGNLGRCRTLTCSCSVGSAWTPSSACRT